MFSDSFVPKTLFSKKIFPMEKCIENVQYFLKYLFLRPILQHFFRKYSFLISFIPKRMISKIKVSLSAFLKICIRKVIFLNFLSLDKIKAF